MLLQHPIVGASTASILTLPNNKGVPGTPLLCNGLNGELNRKFSYPRNFQFDADPPHFVDDAEVFLPEHPFKGTCRLLLGERLPLKDRFHRKRTRTARIDR